MELIAPYRRVVPPEPTKRGMTVVAVHDDGHADVSYGDVIISRVRHMPGLELKRGYRVCVWNEGHDLCITDVIGFHPTLIES